MRGSAVALLLAALAAPAAALAADAGERIEAAAAAHPDDPDLAWLWIQHLAASDRKEEAARRLGQFLERWPELRPEADLQLGRWLFELERDAEAVAQLHRALARDPGSGVAHLYLALALQRMGCLQEALPHFRRAAVLEPELRSEAMLLRALAALELGDETSGRELLRETIDLDPSSEAARNARLVLGVDESAAERPPWYRIEARAGFEGDSNVTLEGDLEIPGGRSDGRAVWDASLSLHPLRRPWGGLTAGTRYAQSHHLALDEYDILEVRGWLSGYARLGERWRLRLDGLGGFARLSDEPYRRDFSARPNLLVSLGPRAGVLRIFGDVEWRWYDEEPFIPSLTRDGIAYGGGFEHVLPLGWREGAWSSARVSFRRVDTEAERDLLGFDGAYDHDRYAGHLYLQLPLFWQLTASLGFSLLVERYQHENVFDALFDEGVGRPPEDARKRRDTVLETRVALVRPLTSFAEVEAYFSYGDYLSNIDVYRYDRIIGGLAVRLHTH